MQFECDLFAMQRIRVPNCAPQVLTDRSAGFVWQDSTVTDGVYRMAAGRQFVGSSDLYEQVHHRRAKNTNTMSNYYFCKLDCVHLHLVPFSNSLFWFVPERDTQWPETIGFRRTHGVKICIHRSIVFESTRPLVTHSCQSVNIFAMTMNRVHNEFNWLWPILGNYYCCRLRWFFLFFFVFTKNIV